MKKQNKLCYNVFTADILDKILYIGYMPYIIPFRNSIQLQVFLTFLICMVQIVIYCLHELLKYFDFSKLQCRLKYYSV